jgi:hypothetical protein
MCLNAGSLWPSGRAIRLLWQSAFSVAETQTMKWPGLGEYSRVRFLLFFLRRSCVDRQALTTLPATPWRREKMCTDLYANMPLKNKQCAFFFSSDSKHLYFWKELLRFLCKYRMYIAATCERVFFFRLFYLV